MTKPTGGSGFLAVFFAALLAARSWQAAGAEPSVPKLPAAKLEWKEKVVYYDPLYDTAHIHHPERLVPYLSAHGFQWKKAGELGAWMREKVARGAYGTVVVMSMGIVPSSVFDPEEGAQSVLLEYLRRGGRVVWLGDVPLAYYQTESSASFSGIDGGPAMLGVRGGWETPIWGDSSKAVRATPVGERWGLVHPGGSVIATYQSDVTWTLSGFHSDDAKAEAAVDWFKNLAPQFPWSGFLFALRGTDLANPAIQQEVYRLALFAGEPVKAPEPPKPVAEQPKCEVSLMLAGPNDRSCYLRGETIPVTAKILRHAPVPSPTRLALSLLWQGREQAGRVFTVDGSGGESRWSLPTTDLACGDYQLRATAWIGSDRVAESERTVSVCPRLTEPTFFFGAWAPSPQNPHRCRLTLEGFARHGLHLGTGGPEMNPLLMDQALRYGLRFSMRIHGDARGPFEPGSNRLGANGEHVPSAWGGGRPMVSLSSPILRQQVAESFAKQLAAIAGYPALWPFCHTNDDFSIRYGLDYSPLVVRQFKEKTGLDAPVPAEIRALGARVDYVGRIQRPPGVVPEDDPWLLWHTFITRAVGGGYNKTILQAAQRVLPGIRLGPVPGGMQWPLWLPGQYPPHQFGPGGFNCLWYYYYLNYWQPLIGALFWDEVARMNNRDLPLWVTAGLYGANEPTYYRNKFFLHLAGGVQGFNYFTYVDGEQRPRGLAEVGRLGTTLVRPYYPLLGRLRPVRHRVRFLLPYTQAIYESDYPLRALYAYANLLSAHVDVEPTCEEEVISGDLKGSQAVLLYQVKWLRRQAYDALAKYAREGGLVLADASTAVEIPGAKRLAVDLAMGLGDGKPSATPARSLGDPGIHDYCVPQRVGAIREAIAGHVRPEVDSPSLHLVIREMQADGIRYLWLVNVHTHEDYEYLRPRLGAGARPANPKLARQEATAYLDALDRQTGGAFTAPVSIPKGYAVYDVLAGKEVPAKDAGDHAEFIAAMSRLGGQLVALYPRRITAVQVTAPEAVSRASEAVVRFEVLGDDGRPMPGCQPIEVEITHDGGVLSEWTGSYLATRGVLELPIRPARNHPPGPWRVRAKELSSGRQSEAQFAVR